MELSRNLKLRRERFSLTQAWVAEALEVPRELLSYWETGARAPNPQQLARLARIYRTTPKRLQAPALDPAADDPLELFGKIDAADPLGEKLTAWISFLDRWAEFLRVDLGRPLPGPGRPPPALAENAIVHDRRRASSRAAAAREHWQLGECALPDLHAFLDQHGVTILRLPLASPDDRSGGVTGAFYNHAELGFCVVVHDGLSASGQTTALAHLLAHILFHYSEVAILCRATADDRLERFADAFAEHFQVPGKTLRERVRERLDRTGRDELQPLDAIVLANLFQVSFPALVTRLASEGLIPAETASDWREIDGPELASRFGLSIPGPPGPADAAGPLARFPASISAAVQRAVAERGISVARAAAVLGVDPRELRRRWLAALPRTEPDARTARGGFERARP